MKKNKDDSIDKYVDLGILGEVLVSVDYHLSPYDPGCSSGPPENCYPPEGGELEILKVTCEKYPCLEQDIAEHLANDDSFYQELIENQQDGYYEGPDDYPDDY